MSIPRPLYTSSHIYESSLSSDFHKKSSHLTLKRPSNDDEQIVKSALSDDIKPKIKRRLINSSTSVISSKMQQQQTANSPTDDSTIGVPSRLCSVCGDISTGIHFGGNSCESCKAFFRRSVQCRRYQNYKCSNDERCPVNAVTRKVCQYCRYIKCTMIGMKSKWVLSDQEREEKYGSRRKRFRDNRTSEEDSDIYKYLTKEEKLLIEDIAHALYQSRATYPLQFPSQLNQYLTSLPATPPSMNSSLSTTEKPPNPSANFLVVPIQRLVLFARMLKDFDLFSEDDKVSLLKGSAVEIMVCSSNTLFNPKTHTFTNYLSRDQRAVMDDQVIPLDPLLKNLWGEDLFDRTRIFLISMCNLHVDEVASTLLVPVMLFSPDRSNIKDLRLVKSLQVKYVTLLRKYMNWRYGVEHTENVYPKLLLQIVNIRTLGLAHAETIQKVMSTSSVNPLVQEVTVKQEVLSNHRSTFSATERMDSLSSTPSDSDKMDYDKNSSIETESTMGSDEDETNSKHARSSVDDEDDLGETNLKNIWRKRRKLTPLMHTELTSLALDNSPKAIINKHLQIKQDLARSSSTDSDKYSHPISPQIRPHDHQVPNFIPTYPDNLTTSNRASSFRHLPPKKQSSITKHNPSYEQVYRTHSSSTNDRSSYDHYSQINPTTVLPAPKQCYDDSYRQYCSRMSPANHQQQKNEQHLHHLSLATNQSHTPPVQSATNYQSHPATLLHSDEQQLLNAIHAHPNKRDLVLNLLRQMNESSLPSSMEHQTHPDYHNHQQQQQYRRS